MENTMPAVKIPFRPHFNTQFKVQVNTPDEQEVCEIFSDADKDTVDEEIAYLETLKNGDPEIVKEPFFIFTNAVVQARKAEIKPSRTEGMGKLLRSIVLGQIRSEVQTVPAQQVLVGPAPVGQSLLGSVFDGIMTDRLAYAKMDANRDSNTLPSAQYVEAKAEATVLWDVLMGRR